MKKIAIVGSTGSIGRQVLSVIEAHPQQFKAVALIASSSAAPFEGQLARHKPRYAALCNAEAAKNVTPPVGTELFGGAEEAERIISDCGADVVFVACGGFDGLKYSLAAIRAGATLALANKETLVCGGDIVMPLADKLVPVDSEHSAIWQCLNFDRRAPFSRLIITASGGPFRGVPFEELGFVTPELALNHPTWKMGAKITVDSATLLNKGYEVIEAHHLYSCPYGKITAVIQPQSVIHSLVEFADGSCLAQMSNPTMELPIQLALTYPERIECALKPLDFSRAFSLDFIPLEREKYPLFDLALKCGEEGGILPTALNAASEVAVSAFLSGLIPFTRIYGVAAQVAEKTVNQSAESYGRLKEADAAARALALSLI